MADLYGLVCLSYWRLWNAFYRWGREKAVGDCVLPYTWKMEICALPLCRKPHCPVIFTWYFNVQLTQESVTVLHLLFLIIAGPAPQSDLEDFIRNWQFWEGCSFPPVCQGLVLTHTPACSLPGLTLDWSGPCCRKPKFAQSVYDVSNFYFTISSPKYSVSVRFCQKNSIECLFKTHSLHYCSL